MTDAHTGSPLEESSSAPNRPAYQARSRTRPERTRGSHSGIRRLGLKPDISRVLRQEGEA
jgi:hypothetical protein